MVLRRPGALTMTALQLVATALLPAADAILDVDLYGPPHLDSPHGSDCADHGHHLCRILQSLMAAGPTPPAALAHPALPPHPHPDDPACAVERAAASPILTGSIIPRAPPAR